MNHTAVNSIHLSQTDSICRLYNKFPVGSCFLASGLRLKLGSGLKSCSGWTCYLLKQWLKTDWTWQTHGYLYPEPHRVSRLSLANIMTSWNVITLSPDFPESPVIPFAFFTVIRTVFRCCSFLSVWIGNIIHIFIWIIKVIDFYKVLVQSLLSGDLLLQTEYKCTIVQITTHYNVLLNEEFLVVVLFEFHSFRLQFILWYDFSIPVFFPIIAA